MSGAVLGTRHVVKPRGVRTDHPILRGEGLSVHLEDRSRPNVQRAGDGVMPHSGVPMLTCGRS